MKLNFGKYFYLFSENRPDESFFRKLDSNLKKNTAFVKKLVCNIQCYIQPCWLLDVSCN